MKSILDNLSRVSASFFPTGDTDIKIKAGGQKGFSGMVWLESQIPGETSWERVPDTLTRQPNQFSIIVNDLTIRYRFASNIEVGSVIAYAGGVTQIDDDVLLNNEATTFGGDADVNW